MDDLDLLDGILRKTAALISGVRPEQVGDPTPCPDYTVGQLVDHMVGWVHVFAAAAQGQAHEGDPARRSDDAGAEFAAASDALLAGWREHGLDRPVRLTGGELPGAMVFNMTLMEYLTHGWDLARGTGQAVPYSDDEATDTLARAEQTLPPQYRGEGKAFGEVVTVPADAPAVDRIIGFMGRQP